MISLLMPTRGRPGNLERFLLSAREHAGESAYEVVLRMDNDDPTLDDCMDVVSAERARGTSIFVRGSKRGILSDCWTQAFEWASGDIVWLQDDEVIFTSDDWAPAIEQFFAEDRFRVGGADEGMGAGHFCCQVLSRRWVELTGHTYPLGFDGDFGDVWIRDTALTIGPDRYQVVPGLTLHQLSAVSGLAPRDATYVERQHRQREQDIRQLFASRTHERHTEAALIRAAMEE